MSEIGEFLSRADQQQESQLAAKTTTGESRLHRFGESETTESSVLQRSSGNTVPCGPSVCNLETSYCKKGEGSSFRQCTPCKQLEKRYKNAKEIADRHPNNSTHSNKSVWNKVIQLFRKKCAVYSKKQAEIRKSTTVTDWSRTIQSSRSYETMMTNPITSPNQVERESEFRIVTEAPLLKPSNGGVWSNTDREVLLAVSCASVFLQLLLLFILILIFCRLVKQRSRQSNEEDEYDDLKKTKKQRLRGQSTSLPKRSKFRKTQVYKETTSKSELLAPNSVNMTPRLEPRNYSMVPVVEPLTPDMRNNDYVLSVSACNTGAVNSPIQPRRSTFKPAFQMQQSKCTCSDCCSQREPSCGDDRCAYAFSLMPQRAAAEPELSAAIVNVLP